MNNQRQGLSDPSRQGAGRRFGQAVDPVLAGELLAYAALHGVLCDNGPDGPPASPSEIFDGAEAQPEVLPHLGTWLAVNLIGYCLAAAETTDGAIDAGVVFAHVHNERQASVADADIAVDDALFHAVNAAVAAEGGHGSPLTELLASGDGRIAAATGTDVRDVLGERHEVDLTVAPRPNTTRPRVESYELPSSGQSRFQLGADRRGPPDTML